MAGSRPRPAAVVIIGGVLMIAVILAVPWCLFVVARRMYRAIPPMRPAPHYRLGPPYGGLPDLGPVGPLGELSPDADIDRGASNSSDLYGY
jgi:hypothetical protein